VTVPRPDYNVRNERLRVQCSAGNVVLELLFILDAILGMLLMFVVTMCNTYNNKSPNCVETEYRSKQLILVMLNITA
jgi:hypothetical protein